VIFNQQKEVKWHGWMLSYTKMRFNSKCNIIVECNCNIAAETIAVLRILTKSCRIFVMRLHGSTTVASISETVFKVYKVIFIASQLPI